MFGHFIFLPGPIRTDYFYLGKTQERIFYQIILAPAPTHKINRFNLRLTLDFNLLLMTVSISSVNMIFDFLDLSFLHILCFSFSGKVVNYNKNYFHRIDYKKIRRKCYSQINDRHFKALSSIHTSCYSKGSNFSCREYRVRYCLCLTSVGVIDSWRI